MEKEEKIKEKDFQKIYKLSDDVYKLSLVSSWFCHKYISNIETIDTIIPVIDHLKNQAGELNIYFIEME